MNYFLSSLAAYLTQPELHKDGEGSSVKLWYFSFWCLTHLFLCQLATEHAFSCTWNSFQPFQSITTSEAIIPTRNDLKTFTNKYKLTNLEFAQWLKCQSFFPCTLSLSALWGLCLSTLRSLYFLCLVCTVFRWWMALLFYMLLMSMITWPYTSSSPPLQDFFAYLCQTLTAMFCCLYENCKGETPHEILLLRPHVLGYPNEI